MTCTHLDIIIVQSSMVIKFISLEDQEKSKPKPSHILSVEIMILRLTEIWSNDGDSQYIQLAEPELKDYKEYPELMLVDTKYCVKS